MNNRYRLLIASTLDPRRVTMQTVADCDLSLYQILDWFGWEHDRLIAEQNKFNAVRWPKKRKA